MLKAIAAIFLAGFNLLWPAALVADDTALPLTLMGTQAHDRDLYTQGLFFSGEFLYESSGLYGQSRLDRRAFPGGRSSASHTLAKEFFAEGATLANGEIYILTWREQTVFVLDAETLAVKRRHTYKGEGWGLAFDGERLWRSDGTAHLYPHRTGDFAPAGEPVKVFSGRHFIDRLNELEWDPAHKVMLANVYGADYVAAIDMPGGQVRRWLDARPIRALAERAGLKSDWQTMNTALNGLALAPDGKSLWLTGKLWPGMYQVVWPPENF